jgi:hypothetical protein
LIKEILKMRKVTLNVKDSKLPLFMELVKSLDFVKKIDIDDQPIENVIENIKNGLKEVSQFKSGKLKTTAAKDFLNEL